MPTDSEFQWLTSPAFDPPSTLLGWFYIALWLVIIGLIVGFNRDALRKIVGQRWLILAGFIALAFVEAIPRFELAGGSLLPPMGTSGGAAVIYRPLGFIAVALSAWVLGPMGALIVGGAEGVSRALFGSHQSAEIFHFAFIGWAVGHLLQQQIRGRRWAVLRLPPIATTLGQLLAGWPFVFLATIFLIPSGTALLTTLDLALVTARPQWAVALLEGLVSGGIVWLAQRTFQLDRPTAAGNTTPPFERDISYQQPLQFLFYSLILLTLLGSAVAAVGYNSARTLIQTQMAQEANEVSRDIAPFINTRQSLLLEWGDDPRLHSADAEAQRASLDELFRTGTFFRRVLLVDASGNIIASVPNASDRPVALSETEAASVNDVARLNSPDQTLSTELDGHPVVLSLIAPATPIQPSDDSERLFLVGRVPDQILNDLVRGLANGQAGSDGYIIGGNRLILAHTDGIEQPEFADELTSGVAALVPPDDTEGIFFVRPDALSNERQLEYRTPPGAGHPWTVVVDVPMGIILQQAFNLVSGVVFIILAMTTLFAGLLAYQGSNLGKRLQNLLAAVERIPDREQGQLVVPKDIGGDDDLGRLGVAFQEMQMKLDQQMGELNLLLNVSQGVSQVQQNIRPGVGRILEQMVDGTDAAGARIVLTILGTPIDFGEGNLHEAMAPFDRQIRPLLADSQDLVLATADAVRRVLNIPAGGDLPFKSAIAYPLRGSNQTDYGYMWLAWHDQHTFRESERSLIRSLSEQASVMVQNWYLYLSVERRRRELGAVLDATVDPVIVTDANNKVSILNPAAYAELNITNRMRHLPVNSLITHEDLVEILTRSAATNPSAPIIEEITLENGKTFNVTVSTIPAQSGRIAGRVAVLRDVSEMKEISDLKSEFVRIASHDLKDPITIVSGFIQMLPLTGPLNEKQKDQVDRIQGAMNSMQKLVEDLLNITRLEAGLAFELVPVSIPDLFTAVVHMLEPLAQTAGNELKIVDTGRIPRLNLNPTFVQQAIFNLVSNALKYAPNTGEILIQAQVVGDEVVISVADSGPGIPQAIRGRLFEKFFRFSQPGQARTKNHGLGLSFVELVAERHSGRVWFDSTEGEGAAFFLAFPNEPAKYL